MKSTATQIVEDFACKLKPCYWIACARISSGSVEGPHHEDRMRLRPYHP